MGPKSSKYFTFVSTSFCFQDGDEDMVKIEYQSQFAFTCCQLSSLLYFNRNKT